MPKTKKEKIETSNEKVPKRIKKGNRKFRLIKEYPNFLMYKNIDTGVKECFKRQELGMNTYQIKIAHINPEKVKK